jgi:hypothetical protein
MVLDSHTGSRAATPSESTPSLTAPSISSDHPIPLHQDSKDSADSWDLVEDLPLRWATNYVNLATTGSKLATQQVLFYEAYKDEKKGTWMLAVATKTCILLYESPKDQKSFRFLRVSSANSVEVVILDGLHTGILHSAAGKVHQFHIPRFT